MSGGVHDVEFDREAPSFEEAVLSAIKDVNQAGIGVRVIRVIPDDLVHANAIAERSGKTRQAVRLWYLGERGEAFPAPKAIVGKSPVWSWVSIVRWLHSRGEIEADAVETARVIAKLKSIDSVDQRFRISIQKISPHDFDHSRQSVGVG